MTGNEAGGLIDRADAERLIKRAHSNRAQFIRNVLKASPRNRLREKMDGAFAIEICDMRNPPSA